MSTSPDQLSPSAFVGRALLVSSDSSVISRLANGMRRFAIKAEPCHDPEKAEALIATRKFEAIVVDSTFGEPASRLFEQIQTSPSNQSSVTFAVIDARGHTSSQVKPKFMMHKPLTDSLVERTLKAALGLVIRDYRRYYRCSIQVPARVKVHGAERSDYQTLNVSESGIALHIPLPLNTGALVVVAFELPGEPTHFRVEAEVCWSNEGRAGLRFTSIAAEQKTRLQGWLSRKIEEGLPEAALGLFQKAQ